MVASFQKWEYHVEALHQAQALACLNYRGQEGWELSGCVMVPVQAGVVAGPGGPEPGFLFFFKRPFGTGKPTGSAEEPADGQGASAARSDAGSSVILTS